MPCSMAVGKIQTMIEIYVLLIQFHYKVHIIREKSQPHSCAGVFGCYGGTNQQHLRPCTVLQSSDTLEAQHPWWAEHPASGRALWVDI